MKTLYWLPLAALAAFAADCGDPIDTNDSDVDTDTTFQGDFLISSVALTCESPLNGDDPTDSKADDVITLDVLFQGWAEIVELDIIETGSGAFPGPGVYQEYHILPADANTAFAADGSSDTWQYVMGGSDSLVGETDTPDGEPNRISGTTHFDCSDSNRLQQFTYTGTDADGNATTTSVFSSVAVKVTATADDASQEPDCLIFGEKSRTAFGDDCLCAETFFVNPPANPCGDHSAP